MGNPVAFGTRSRRDFITAIAATAGATILAPNFIAPSLAGNRPKRSAARKIDDSLNTIKPRGVSVL